MSAHNEIEGQKVKSTSVEVGATEPKTKIRTVAGIERKCQMLLPGWRQFQRVQTIMNDDAALEKYLGPKTHEAKKRSGEKILFSPEAVKVALALNDRGLDAAGVRRQTILHMAQSMFILNNVSTAFHSSPFGAPALSTVKSSQMSDLPVSNGPESACTESSNMGTHEKVTLKELVLDENAQLEVCSDPIELPENLKDFGAKIKRRIQCQADQFISSTIAIGEAFLAATKKYNRNFRQLATESGVAYVTVTQYVKVAKRFGRKQKNWAPAQFPPSVDSLMRLARLDSHQLCDAIRLGKVTPGMGRKDVKALLNEYRPVKRKSVCHISPIEAAVPSASGALTAVKSQLTSFQKDVEDWQRRNPAFKRELILTLEECIGWAQKLTRMLRSVIEE